MTPFSEAREGVPGVSSLTCGRGFGPARLSPRRHRATLRVAKVVAPQGAPVTEQTQKDCA